MRRVDSIILQHPGMGSQMRRISVLYNAEWCRYEDIYYYLFTAGNFIMLAAGASFSIGLSSLVVSALLSLWASPRQPTEPPQHQSDDPALERMVTEPPTDSSPPTLEPVQEGEVRRRLSRQ